MASRELQSHPHYMPGCPNIFNCYSQGSHPSPAITPPPPRVSPMPPIVSPPPPISPTHPVVSPPPPVLPMPPVVSPPPPVLPSPPMVFPPPPVADPTLPPVLPTPSPSLAALPSLPEEQPSGLGGISSTPASNKAVSITAGVGAAVVVLMVLVLAYYYYSLNKKKKKRKKEALPSSHDLRKEQQTPPTQGAAAISIAPPKAPEEQSSSHHTSTSSSSFVPFSDSSQKPQASFTSQPITSTVSAFTYKDIADATQGFSDENMLGQGGFGYVYRGKLLDGKEVAVKQLRIGSQQGDREFYAEVEIISRVHHKHLVTLVGYCMHEDKRLLVYEFVPNKTLDFHLHAKRQPTMDWSTRMKIALGSAKGLAYLHEDCCPKIIHRDIKAENVLLDLNFEVKLSDFGLAKLTPENDRTHISTRVMGTFGYLAPEYASTGKLTDKSDVFSYGVMILELITGQRPVISVRGQIEESLVDQARPLLIEAIERNKYDSLVDPRLENNYDLDQLRRLVACAAACVRYSAKIRPRMGQVVRVLEGGVSLDELNSGVVPGRSILFKPSEISNQDS